MKENRFQTIQPSADFMRRRNFPRKRRVETAMRNNALIIPYPAVRAIKKGLCRCRVAEWSIIL